MSRYKNAYASDASPTAVSMLDMGMRPFAADSGAGHDHDHDHDHDDDDTAPYPPHGPNPGRTYRFLAKPEFQKFPFGHGLTFGASFVYSSPTISVAHVPVATVNGVVKAADAPRTRYIAAALAHVSIEVANVGSRAAGHSVLLFAAPPNAGKDGSPINSLVAFERIPSVAAGDKATVTLALTAWSLALADTKGVWGGMTGNWTFSASNGTTGSAVISIPLVVA